MIVVVRVLGCCARLGLLASDCGFAAAAWEQASHRVGAGDIDYHPVLRMLSLLGFVEMYTSAR